MPLETSGLSSHNPSRPNLLSSMHYLPSPPRCDLEPHDLFPSGRSYGPDRRGAEGILPRGLPGASGHLLLIPKQQAFEGIGGSLKGQLL